MVRRVGSGLRGPACMEMQELLRCPNGREKGVLRGNQWLDYLASNAIIANQQADPVPPVLSVSTVHWKPFPRF